MEEKSFVVILGSRSGVYLDQTNLCKNGQDSITVSDLCEFNNHPINIVDNWDIPSGCSLYDSQLYFNENSDSVAQHGEYRRAVCISKYFDVVIAIHKKKHTQVSKRVSKSISKLVHSCRNNDSLLNIKLDKTSQNIFRKIMMIFLCVFFF